MPSFRGEFDGKAVEFPYLEILASKGADGQTVFLMVINKHAERSAGLAVRVTKMQGFLKARLVELVGDHPFEEVTTLAVREIGAHAGIVRWTVPPHSVTALEFGSWD